MRLLKAFTRPAAAPSKLRPATRELPARTPSTRAPSKGASAATAYERLRTIADLDNEATRQIDEAQALLAQTLDECPAIYIEEAIARLKAAREILQPLGQPADKKPA